MLTVPYTNSWPTESMGILKIFKKCFFYATKTCIIHWFQDWTGDRNLIGLKETTHKGLEESEKNVFGS